jgi:hypothetical protein
MPLAATDIRDKLSLGVACDLQRYMAGFLQHYGVVMHMALPLRRRNLLHAQPIF